MTATAFKTETLTNRISGKTAAIRVKLTAGNLRFITSRQYNFALQKLGQGPLHCTGPLLVLDAMGSPYAALCEGNQ